MSGVGEEEEGAAWLSPLLAVELCNKERVCPGAEPSCSCSTPGAGVRTEDAPKAMRDAQALRGGVSLLGTGPERSPITSEARRQNPHKKTFLRSPLPPRLTFFFVVKMTGTS